MSFSKCTNRIISSLVAIILLITLFPLANLPGLMPTAEAVGSSFAVTATGHFKQGEIIDIKVDASGVQGATSGVVYLRFNGDVFDFVSASGGNLNSSQTNAGTNNKIIVRSFSVSNGLSDSSVTFLTAKLRVKTVTSTTIDVTANDWEGSTKPSDTSLTLTASQLAITKTGNFSNGANINVKVEGEGVQGAKSGVVYLRFDGDVFDVVSANESAALDNSENNAVTNNKVIARSFTSANGLGSGKVTFFTAVLRVKNAKTTTLDATAGDWTNAVTPENKSLTLSPDVSYTVGFNANGGAGAPASLTSPCVLPTGPSTAKSYTITLNANGGNVSPSTRVANCTFKNWNTYANGTGASYNAGVNYTATANTTLYAQWTDPTAGNLPDATRAGYTFSGWYTSLNGGTRVTSSTKITANTTFYAHWQPVSPAFVITKTGDFTVGSTMEVAVKATSVEGVTAGVAYLTFDGDVFEFVSSDAGVQDESSNYGLGETVNDKVIVYDFTFIGGLDRSDISLFTARLRVKSVKSTTLSVTGSGWNGVQTPSAASLSFGANSTYTLRYSASGATGVPNNQTGNSTYTISSGIPKKFGYNFLGWSKSSTATSATYQPGGNITLTGDTTLYAVWSQPSISVNTTANAAINYTGVTYYLKFIPSQSGTYSFTSSATSGDPYGYIYNSSGTEIAHDDDSAGNRNFKIEQSLTAGTTYYLGVRYFGNGSTGTIPVRIEKKSTYTVSFNANSGSGAPASLTSPCTLPAGPSTAKSYTVTFNANGTGGSVSQSTKKVNCTFKNWNTNASGTGTSYNAGVNYTAAANITLYAQWTNPAAGELPNATRSGYTFSGWYTSASGGTKITSSSTITANTTLYAHWQSVPVSTNIYNLGEETYSFVNYGDSDSPGGHCFGMSATSSGYYLGLLDIGIIGGNANTPLYTIFKTNTVTAPICYYQQRQGSPASTATVAGGSRYLNGVSNIGSDWPAVVNYVKNHSHDGKGDLQIGFRRDSQGGHAINFLRYENVNGQDRIYAYDNNFPTQEVYFYKDSSGRVYETPKSTFSGAIDCIALRSVPTYFSVVGGFEASRYIYTTEDEIIVNGATKYYLDEIGDEYVAYKVPDNKNSVTITPLVDNASFVYMDENYNFGPITNDTYGIFTLKLADDATNAAGQTGLNIINSANTDLFIVKQPANVTVENGQTAATKVIATGEGLAYKWYFKNANSAKFSASSNTTATYSVIMNAERDGRQVYCVITDKYGNSVQSNTVTLSMMKPASITTQPKNVKVAKAGDTAKIAVKASGDGLTYQWYYKDTTMSSFKASSVTTDTYSYPVTAARNGRKVYCIVADTYGNTVKSNTVTMSIAASITAQPKSVKVAKAGDTAKITVKASGDGLTYQWYYKDTKMSSFKASSVTSTTYSYPVTSDRDGRKVYCIVSDKYGNSIKSDTATMSIAVPVAITTQPKSVKVAKAGDTAKITVKASGDGLTYKWYYKDTTMTSFKVSSVTTATYSYPVTSDRNGRKVYCIVSDKYGNSKKSDTATMSIAVPVAITTQPKSVKVAKAGDTAKITVIASGDGLTYKWYYKDTTMSSFKVSSVTTATYSYPVTVARNGRKVYCVVSDTYGNSVKSNTVTMNIAVSITTQPKSVNVPKADNTAKITVKASGDGLTYKWYYKDTTMSSFKVSSVTTATYSYPVTVARNGRKVYCIVSDKYGNSVKSNTVTMSIVASITTQPKSVKVVKTGDTAKITIKASGDGLTYQWYYKDATMTGFKASSVTTATYSYPVTAARNGRKVYCVVTDKYGNTVKSNTVTMSIGA